MADPREVPVPFYRLAHKGSTLKIARKGSMAEAVEWLKGRYSDYAIIVNLDGEERTVLRGGQVG
jgi:hypothetical protein